MFDNKYIKVFFLLVLLAFPIFGQLDYMGIRLWDEARLANNAIEMIKNGNYLVPQYEGHPDMWNTKPPLLIWLQVLCIKNISSFEVAMRLPSAIAGLGICMMLLIFLWRYLDDFWIPFMTIMVLITSPVFTAHHSIRSCDYDALLTFFTTLYCLAFFAYIETDNKKYIFLVLVGILLAVMTKSVAGLFLAPPLLLYAWYRQKILVLLKEKCWYWGSLTVLSILAWYYFGRERINPGYIQAVLTNEWGGRYFHTVERHSNGVFYYFQMLYDFQFKIWTLFLPISFIIGPKSKIRGIRRFTIFSFMISVWLILLLTFGKTSLEWYMLPAFPFIAFLVSNVIYSLFLFIKDQYINDREWIQKGYPYLFVILMFAIPYVLTVNNLYFERDPDWNAQSHALATYMKKVSQHQAKLISSYYCFEDYNALNNIYEFVLLKKGYQIYKLSLSEFKPGSKILICQQTVLDYIEFHYTFTKEVIFDGVCLVNIKSNKN